MTVVPSIDPARFLEEQLAVEIGDWDRFTGSTIGAFLWPAS